MNIVYSDQDIERVATNYLDTCLTEGHLTLQRGNQDFLSTCQRVGLEVSDLTFKSKLGCEASLRWLTGEPLSATVNSVSAHCEVVKVTGVSDSGHVCLPWLLGEDHLRQWRVGVLSIEDLLAVEPRGDG